MTGSSIRAGELVLVGVAPARRYRTDTGDTAIDRWHAEGLVASSRPASVIVGNTGSSPLAPAGRLGTAAALGSLFAADGNAVLATNGVQA
ncbi:hypothetical protein Ato02nite_096720 [Paractinoplanes toevensis]|uniref:Uncharacterized protein n=1 Tax=Paractinoplanes toevensis TaxID=571911 RepID=A0A919WCU9_9ACTN|nr:hypothetical protein Ato02nite_096720 [Actinoplanes toevensis]